MHRIADHGMAWHGILESRAHRGAERRGRVLSDDLFGKHYGPAGEKNRTPPTRESGSYNLEGLAPISRRAPADRPIGAAARGVRFG